MYNFSSTIVGKYCDKPQENLLTKESIKNSLVKSNITYIFIEAFINIQSWWLSIESNYKIVIFSSFIAN